MSTRAPQTITAMPHGGRGNCFSVVFTSLAVVCAGVVGDVVLSTVIIKRPKYFTIYNATKIIC